MTVSDNDDFHSENENENDIQTEDENDIYLKPLRDPKCNTDADRKKLCKTQLDEGFSNNYNLFIEDPSHYTALMGDVIVLKTCAMCKAPRILHVTKPGEVCKLPILPSASNSMLTLYLDKVSNFSAIKAITTYHKMAMEKKAEIPKTESQTVNVTNEKRSKLPAFTKSNYSYWEGMVKNWDTSYPNTKPLDKFLELLEALGKGEGGDDLCTKLQSEGLNYLESDIITKCLTKIASYLEQTVMSKAEEINKKWNDLYRPSDQPTADFMAKFELIMAQQKEAGLVLNTKQRAIQCFTKANLDSNMRNIVIPQVDLDSAQAMHQLKKAILNVTPTPGSTSNYYSNQRGRTMTRDNRGRSRSFSYTYKRRCPCSDCKTHDKKYNEGRSPSNGSMQSNRGYNTPRNDGNAGNKSDTFVSSVYLNLSSRQIVIDTGCVRSIMSKHDVPYLESLINRKLEPTGDSYGVRFGDNKTTQTEAVVMVPFWDGKDIKELKVGIVKDKIPFLLGLCFLRQLNGRIAIDDKLELKNGATFPMTGGGNGHQKIEWTRYLHCGPTKVSQDSSQIDNDSPQSYYESTIDPDFQDFFNEDEMVCFKADITVNQRDILLDDVSTKHLNHFFPLCRAGEYNDMDTDSVYLYRNNITEKLPVRNPFEFSELGNGIMKTSHDRGIREGIDLEELDQEERERGNLQVSFDKVVNQISFDPLESPIDQTTISKSNIPLADNERTFYTDLTRKEIEVKLPEKIEKKDKEFDLSELRLSEKALPIDMCFFIRSSGHILDLNTSKMTEGSENMNFKTYIETKTGKKSSFSDENSPKFSEKLLYDSKLINELERVPNLHDIDDFSNKQEHDAQKKKAPKRKAIRGHKKSSQSLKPNAEIPEIKDAMDVEIEKFKKYQVFEEVNDSPYIYKIPSNWVVTKKDSKKEGENKYKCRLVALGNLDRKINLKKTDSPTLSRESLRLVLSTIANYEFDLQGCDVSSAFLQGAPLDREVYMYPPKEFRTPGKVWLLKKPVYGLADSGRLWYQRLREEILKLGCKELTGDGAFFHMHKNGELIGLVGTHVDDLIYGGTPEFEQTVITPLMNTFNISKTDHESFVFCGMSLRQNSDYSITVSQRDYAQTIENLPDYSNFSDPEKLTLLKSVAGQVGYLSLTRPDLVFDSSELLRVGKTLDERLKLAEKLLVKVKNGSGDITFNKLGDLDDLELVCYSDASYNNIKYGKVSTAGCVILLKGNFGHCAPIFWTSKPITRVTRSTMAAEARALELAVDYAILFSRQIREIYTGERTTNGITVKCYIDSNTLHDAIVSSRQFEEKALIHLIYCLRDKILHNEVQKITWVGTKSMLADGLTKSNISMERLMHMIRTGTFPKNFFK